MALSDYTDHPTLRRQDYLADGGTDLELHLAVRRGELTRIGPGSYATPQPWARLDAIDRHRIRVLDSRQRLSPDTVYARHAAAALWDIRLLGAWPRRIDTLIEEASGGRSSGLVARHSSGFDGVEIVELDGMLVTSPAQTAVDLARVLPFAEGVAVIDSVLWRKRRPGPLAQRIDIEQRLQSSRNRRGWQKSAAAVEFATDLSDSVEESHSRVLIRQLGFPSPELQVRFELLDGGTADVDFYWPDHDHAGECDGRSKYSDPRLRRGRTAEEVVIDEKNRENALRRVVSGLSRWEPRDHYPPRRLYDILRASGLPSSGSRRWNLP